MTHKLGRISDVFIGRPRTLPDPLREGQTFRTSMCRSPVDGPVQLEAGGLVGDEVTDKKYHGHPWQAMLLFAGRHYAEWRDETGLDAMQPGGFGENVTIDSITEADVCLGDHLSLGTAVVEVTAPRVPCSKVDRRFGQKGITKRVTETARGGWYVRVVQPGTFRVGNDVTLLQRPAPGVTVVMAARAGYGPEPWEDAARQVLQSGVGAREFIDSVQARMGSVQATSS